MLYAFWAAPSSFQRLMNQFFRGLPYVTNDILIHSASLPEHLLHLKAVFDCLHQANLSLRGRKCHIAMSQVPYLGHIFSDVSR